MLKETIEIHDCHIVKTDGRREMNKIVQRTILTTFPLPFAINNESKVKVVRKYCALVGYCIDQIIIVTRFLTVRPYPNAKHKSRLNNTRLSRVVFVLFISVVITVSKRTLKSRKS